MDFYIDSHFYRDMYISINVTMAGPSGNQTLYYIETVFIPTFGQWQFNINHTFTEAGHYDVNFTLIDDTEKVWWTSCWWDIAEPPGTGFYFWIYQDNYAFVGEERWMNFSIYSNFSHSMYVSINVTLDYPSGTDFILYSNDAVFIPSYTFWNISLSYTFQQSGYYYVDLILIDDVHMEWYTSCWWQISEKMPEYFDLWIYQDNYASIGEQRWMNFYIDSEFSHDMNISIEIILAGPIGNETLYYNTSVFMPPYGHWSLYIDYNFTNVGYYKVYFIILDDILAKWVAECFWEISDVSTTTSAPPYISNTTPSTIPSNYTSIPENSSALSTESTAPTLAVTPSFEAILTVFTIILVLIKRKRCQ